MATEIAANLAAVEGRIAAACARSGRLRREVTLIAVSKTFPPEAIDQAVSAGINDIGENRVQELKGKLEALKTKPRIHLIGTLQSNKVRQAVKLFDVIQTVDSVVLAERIFREAVSAERILDVLVEVNVGSEPQKGGAMPAQVPEIVQALTLMPNVRLSGLMTIPPHGPAEVTRAFFRQMRLLRDDLLPGSQLSMGMSEDFEVAIEEGATMIRVGRAIFGARDINAAR